MNKVHQVITDTIIKAIEAGETVPWRKTWQGPNGRPVNHRGIPYRGINTFILHFAKVNNGFASNFWLTPNQVRKMGGEIVKGSKVQYITFWKVGDKREVTDPETGEVSIKRSFLLRYYKVVNLDQTVGCKLTRKMQAEGQAPTVNPDTTPIDEAEAIVATYFAQDNAPTLVERGDQPCYYPALDTVEVPEAQYFESMDYRYAALFHEMGHSTGHKSRADRKSINGFSHGSYGKEELVAEMTAAMLCGDAGIEQATIDDHAAYLASWLKAIKADPELLVTAAGQAQRAVDIIYGTTFKAEDED